MYFHEINVAKKLKYDKNIARGFPEKLYIGLWIDKVLLVLTYSLTGCIPYAKFIRTRISWMLIWQDSLVVAPCNVDRTPFLQIGGKGHCSMSFRFWNFYFRRLQFSGRWILLMFEKRWNVNFQDRKFSDECIRWTLGPSYCLAEIVDAINTWILHFSGHNYFVDSCR